MQFKSTISVCVPFEEKDQYNSFVIGYTNVWPNFVAAYFP